jgi:hypothetical protein
MQADSLVVRFRAILALTEVLEEREALEIARPHFQEILTVYVKLLEEVDNERLISSL